jgi:hypothetical protein
MHGPLNVKLKCYFALFFLHKNFVGLLRRNSSRILYSFAFSTDRDILVLSLE